jgi:hypothetical protein
VPRPKLTNAELRSQPLDVAVTSMPAITVDPPVGGATEAKQDAQLAKMPTLEGGRLPVVLPAGGGGLTDDELRAGPVPVSGTFWPNTQPVSGSVAVSNFPGSQAVTGAFWQATQPVSLAASVAVTGSFWQSTQPVSIAAPVAVTGTFFQPTQPVSGTLTVNVGLTNTELRAANVPVQVKTANRVRCTFVFQNTSTVAEALLSLSKNLGGTVTSGTSHTATAGKVLRLTGIAYTLKAGAAAAAFATLNIRALATTTLIGSPSIFRAEFGLTAATSGSALSQFVPLPDGMEFTGTDSFGATLACQATTNVHSLTLFGYEYTP